MELKLTLFGCLTTVTKYVLIVPFMELKPDCIQPTVHVLHLS